MQALYLLQYKYVKGLLKL